MKKLENIVNNLNCTLGKGMFSKSVKKAENGFNYLKSNIKKISLVSATALMFFFGVSLYSCKNLVPLPEPTQIEQTQETSEKTTSLKDIDFNYCISDSSNKKIIIYTTKEDYPEGFSTIRLNHYDADTKSYLTRAFSNDYYSFTFKDSEFLYALFREETIDIDNGKYITKVILDNSDPDDPSNYLEGLLTIDEDSSLETLLNYSRTGNYLLINTNDFGRISFFKDNDVDPFIAVNAKASNYLLDLSKFIDKDENGLFIRAQLFNDEETKYYTKKLYFSLSGRFVDESPANYSSGSITPAVKIENETSTLIKLFEAAKLSVYGAYVDDDLSENNATINYVINPYVSSSIPEDRIAVPDAERYMIFIAPTGSYDVGSKITISTGINDAEDLNYDNIESLKIYYLSDNF